MRPFGESLGKSSAYITGTSGTLVVCSKLIASIYYYGTSFNLVYVRTLGN